MSALGHKRTLRLVSGHQQTHRRSPLYAISGSRHNQIGIMTSPDAPLGLRKGTLLLNVQPFGLPETAVAFKPGWRSP
jgi:hypothetical protein